MVVFVVLICFFGVFFQACYHLIWFYVLISYSCPYLSTGNDPQCIEVSGFHFTVSQVMCIVSFFGSPFVVWFCYAFVVL